MRTRALLCALLTSCVGEIGEILGRPAQDSELVCGQRPELHRLSGEQYRAVVAALLPDARALATMPVPFAQPRRSDLFSTWSRQASVGEYEIDEVWGAADTVARVWASDPAHVCAGPERSACISRVWTSALRTIWSRPPSAAELEEIGNALDDAESELDATEAATTMMRSTLMSASFLFRSEGLEGTLTSDEVATALSFTLLDRPPDEALRAAIGPEPNADAIRGEVRRIFSTPSAVPALRRFVAELFQYGRAIEVQKDRSAYPFHRAAELIDDTEHVVGRLVDEHADSGLLRALLTSELVHARAATAQSWAVATQATNDGIFVQEPGRVGVLTHPAWLAAMSHPDENHLVRRGLFVRERLLCGAVPPIPGGVVPQVPDVPGKSLRERIAEHSSNPACVACHQLMDPLGAAFEAWDHVGQPRTVDNETAVDTAGELIGAGDDFDGTYLDARDLMERLASSDVARACWVTQLYRFVHGRDVRASDLCELERLTALYNETGEDSVSVIAEMFASPEYLQRSYTTR